MLSSRSVSSFVKYVKQLEDVLDVFLNEAQHFRRVRAPFVEEVADFSPRRGSAPLSLIAIGVSLLYVSAVRPFVQNLCEYLANAGAKVASSVWISWIQSKNCAFPSVT